MKTLTIGTVAREAGVGVETIRFYEREGLLEQPERRSSGYRQYGEDAISVLRFIRRAKELGFTLQEIKGLLELRLDAFATRTEVRQRAKAKLADIEGKIYDLERMKQALVPLIEACNGKGKLAGCPILNAMESPCPHQ